MVAYNTNDYLEEILAELTELAKAVTIQTTLLQGQKAESKTNNSTNISPVMQLRKTTSNVTENQQTSQLGSTLTALSKIQSKELDNTLNSLRNFGKVIETLSKVKKEDITKISNNITSLGKAIKSLQLKKEDVEGFNQMVNALTKMNDVFGELSDHFFKNFFKFNPLKAKALGRRLGNFYKNLFEEFQKANFEDTITKIKGGDKEMGTTMTGLSSFITSLFAVDWKQLLKVKNALRTPGWKTAGSNLAEFLDPILKLVSTLPEAKSTGQTYKKDKDGNWSLGETFQPDPRMNQLVTMLQALCAIKTSDVLTLWTMGMLLGPKTGNAIAGFIKAIVDIDVDEKKVKNTISLFKSISLMIGVMTLSLVALTVTAAVGKVNALAGLGLLAMLIAFSYGTIKLFSTEKIQKNTKTSLYTVAGIAAMILALTTCLAITTSISKNNKIEDIGLGVLMLASVIGMSLLIIKKLSNNKIQKNAVESLITIAGIMTLILGLTLCLKITTNIAKENDIKDILAGGAILLGVVGLSLGLLWLLSRDSLQKNMLKGVLGLAGIVILLGGLTFITSKFLDVADKASGLTQKDIWTTFGLMFALIGGTIAIATLLGAIASTGIGAGLIVGAMAMLGGIELLTAGLISTLDMFIDLVDKTNNVLTIDRIKYATDMWVGTGSENGDNISAIGCIIKIVSSLSEMSAGAAIKVGFISKNLQPVMTTLSMFVDVIEKMANMRMVDHYDDKGNPVYKAFDKTIFSDAAEVLAEGFSTFITKLGDKDNGLSTWKLRRVLKALKRGNLPKLMLSLKGFVDVIQQMATMKFVEGYDKDGNPTGYKVFNSKDFETAAISLTVGFTTFLKTLDTNLTNSRHLKKVLKALKKGDIQGLMVGLGSFTNTISQMASLKMVSEYKEDGTPVYTKMKDEDFTKAATTLSTAFGTFLSELENSVTDSDDLKKILKSLKKGNISDLMGSLGSFSEAIIKMANTDQTKDMKAAAVKLGQAFVSLFTELAKSKKVIKRIDAKKISEISSALNELFTAFKDMTADRMKDITGALTELISFAKINTLSFKESRAFNRTITSISEGLTALAEAFNTKGMNKVDGEKIKSITSGLTSLATYIKASSPSEKKANEFKKSMTSMKAGIKELAEALATRNFLSNISKITEAMRKFDAQLIDKDADRVKAIRNMTTEFKGVNDELSKLNTTMQESNSIRNQQDNFKFISQNSLLGSAVAASKNFIGSVKDKIEDKALELKGDGKKSVADIEKQQPQIDFSQIGNVVAKAVIQGLEAWASQQKVVNVQFGQSDAKKLVGIMSNN